MIRLDDVRYVPILSLESVGHALGNKSSRVSCEIDFTVLQYFKASDTSRVTLGSDQYPSVDYLVSFDNKPIFADFNEGDLIDISGTIPAAANDLSGVEIIEKVNDNVIRIDTVFPSPNLTNNAVVIEMTTPIKAIRYFFGIIENNESTNFN